MSKPTASQELDHIFAVHGGWKAEMLIQIRSVITEVDGISEEVKWKMPSRPEGLPVWSSNGIVCFAEIWKDNIKLLFPKGAKLKDPDNLFNARLKSSSIRAIEFKEGDKIRVGLLKEMTDQAVQLNTRTQ